MGVTGVCASIVSHSMNALGFSISRRRKEETVLQSSWQAKRAAIGEEILFVLFLRMYVLVIQ